MAGTGFWLPEQGVSAMEEPDRDRDVNRRSNWTDVEDGILWELVGMIGRKWADVAAELTAKLAERNMPEPQHSVNADACRGRYDRLRRERGAADDEPASIPQPQGRPPKDKVWDSVRGKWIDGPTHQTCLKCKLGKGKCRKKGHPGHLPGPSGTSASGGGATAADPTPHHVPQPQGRPPKGKVWDSVRGRWIDAQLNRKVQPPRGQSPVGGTQSTRNGAATSPHISGANGHKNMGRNAQNQAYFEAQVDQLIKLKTDFEAQVDQFVAERGGSKASHLKDISCRYLVPVGFSENTADRWLKGAIASQPLIEQAVKRFIDDRTKTTPEFSSGHGRVAGPSVDGLDLGLAAKEVAAQAELRTKRKRYDEEQAAIKRRYDEETAANEQRWKEDEAGSSRKLQKIRDLRKDAEDLAAEQLARAAQLVARAAEL
jgi:hypothetical protein